MKESQNEVSTLNNSWMNSCIYRSYLKSVYGKVCVFACVCLRARESIRWVLKYHVADTVDCHSPFNCVPVAMPQP